MFFLADGRDSVSYSVFALIIVLLFTTKTLLFHRRFLIVGTVFLIIFISQAVSFSFIPVITILGFFVKLYIAYGVIRIVHDFPKIFVYVMIFVSAFSLMFYIPDRILSLFDIDLRHAFFPFSEFLNIQNSGVNEHINIGFYNFHTGQNASRNAAFFWEPGAFAGYLILAILFLSVCKQRLSKVATNAYLTLFVLTLLTTQSTMGLIVLPFVLLLFLKISFSTPSSRRNAMVTVTLVVSLLVAFVFFVSKLDSVGGKLIHLYSIGVNQEAGWELSRFGSMIFDMAYVQARPITGWGQNLETQFQLNKDMEGFYLGNGMTGFVRQMGILGMLIFLYAVWLGFQSLGQAKGRSLLTMFVILLALNGEYFLSYPLFMSLMFIGVRDVRKSAQGRRYGYP
jgi:hypothetical protein